MGQIGRPKEVIEVEPATNPYEGEEIKSPKREKEQETEKVPHRDEAEDS